MSTRTIGTVGRQPTLIYDGDCGFCIYWGRYWQKFTGSKVSYSPCQEGAAEYPKILVAEFQRAVKFVAPNGTVASGAEACFLLLSYTRGTAFWLTLYRLVPGFEAISERVYTFVASK